MLYRALCRVMWLLTRVWFRPVVVGAARVRRPVVLDVDHLATIDSFVVALIGINLAKPAGTLVPLPRRIAVRPGAA